MNQLEQLSQIELCAYALYGEAKEPLNRREIEVREIMYEVRDLIDCVEMGIRGAAIQILIDSAREKLKMVQLIFGSDHI